ncbi:MAG: hypothetical protein IPM23_01130 [Candidatus Melainabacteria bacterium]|nr:hypothetical protein [Candidatus Melainabacteria bacterium]
MILPMEEELIGVEFEHKDYWEWEGFEGLCLEDSNVRAITVSREMVFDLDLLLNEQHEAFSRSKKGRMRGKLKFAEVTEYTWTGQHVRPALKDGKDPDLGTIDALYFENGWYYIFGEWGELKFRASARSLDLSAR